MSLALLFPGQGAQTPGFLHRLPDLPMVGETLDRASEILGCDVLTLDTESSLESTVATQICLVVSGAAFWSFLTAEGIRPQAVAGMSVGTYAAAIACGSLRFEDALVLVRRRAELMEFVFPDSSYGLAALQGLTLAQVETLLRRPGLSIANFNSETHFVAAGLREDLKLLLHEAVALGASKAMILNTAVPSHVPQFKSIAKELLGMARHLPISAPQTTILANLNARPITTAEGICEELALGVANPVHWHDIMSALAGLGVDLLIEAPPGHSLISIASETLHDVHGLSAEDVRWDVLVRAARRS
jgi:malonate decarboxylase epsilon subunit